MAKRPNFRTVSDARAAVPMSSDQRRRERLQPLLTLNDRLKRHPMLFWGIIWVAVALPSAFAAGSLINPNAVEPQMIVAVAQHSNTETAKPVPQPVVDSGQLPLWVFGAIAVGCTASCFMLASYIKPIEMQTAEIGFEGGFEGGFEEPTAISQTALYERSQRPINSSKQPLRRLKPYEMTEALPFQVGRSQPIQPLTAEWISSTQQFLDSPYLSKDDVAEPVLVTVMPAEETQLLDWGEAQLADAMDLRRRYPLHFIANNNFQS